MDGFLKWVEAHPAESAIIGIGGVVVIMWMLGFFSSKPASGDAGTANMAAAYYAAEAQQAVVGGQIQIATIGAQASTAQALAGDSAAVAINKAQTHAATVINGQNANTTTTLGGQQLLATYSNNATAVTVNDSNNRAATAINAANNSSSVFTSWINNILPSEIAQYGASGFTASIPGVGTYASGGAPDPSTLRATGWTDSAIAKFFNW